jgi:broad specificity phosphatase PhoE
LRGAYDASAWNLTSAREGHVQGSDPRTWPSVTIILLARHGESDWNAERRWQGHADRPLTERGRAQAQALAERLAEIALDGVYASDLERARATADVVARSQGLGVTVLPALREVDVGSWSGLTRDEARERFPADYRRWLESGPGWTDGETYEAMSERVLAAVRRLISTHPDGRLLVVSHGGPIRAVHAHALGMDVHAYRRLRPVEPNARLSAVCAENGRLTRLCPAGEIADLIAEDERVRAEAGARPPSPAG